MFDLFLPLIFLVLLCRTFCFEPFNIPAGSMVPTLLVGDYVFVSKSAYGYSRYSLPFGMPLISGRVLPWFSHLPQRGDVAVFRVPTNPSIDYIKRVVGLPGDSVQMRHGELYINDRLVPRRPDETCSVDERDAGLPMPQQQGYRESLPRDPGQAPAEHCIIKIGSDGPLDNTPVYQVPADRYFVLGDNRDNSMDSRVLSAFGYVPIANFVGRASRLYYSTRGDELRPERIGLAVQ